MDHLPVGICPSPGCYSHYYTMDLRRIRSTRIYWDTCFHSCLWSLDFVIMELRAGKKVCRYGLRYRCMPLVRNWKKYSKDEIISIEVRQKSVLWRFAGLGIRYRIGHWAYIFNNKYSVFVTLKNKQFELSTRKPEEIRSMVAEWKSEN